RTVIEELASEHLGRPIQVELSTGAATAPTSADAGHKAIEDGGAKAKLQGRVDYPKVKYALAYARLGYRVHPCHEIERDGECSCGKLECSSAGKHPRYSGWQTEATRDEAKITALWREHPEANIGVLCGADNNLLALDVDVKNGHDGIATLRDLELEHGELPEGPIVITPTGGRHYLFQHEAGIGNAVGFAEGLDVRTEGGYIVGVGSRTKAGPYLFDEAFKLGGDLMPPKAPPWLIELIRAAKAKADNNGGFKFDEGKIPAGQRNNTLYRGGRSMRAKGWSKAAIAAAIKVQNTECCDPPLDEAEIDQILVQIFEQPDQGDQVAVSVRKFKRRSRWAHTAGLAGEYEEEAGSGGA